MDKQTTETGPMRAVPLDCKVRGPKDWIRIQREYITAIKPFNDMKYRVYSVTLPRITIHPDGRAEHEYDFTESQKETLRLADEGITHVQRSMGLTPNVLAEGLP